LNSDFLWKSHVEAITSKATQRIYFLKQLRRAGIPQPQLLHFYTGVIRPVLEYAAPVWKNLLSSTQIDQIEAIKRRALVIIYSYTNDMPYINTLYRASISSLVDHRNQLSRKFFQISLTTLYLSSYHFTYSSGSYNYNSIKICKQISKPPQLYQKIPDIYLLRSCSLPNFITLLSPVTIQFVVDVYHLCPVLFLVVSVTFLLWPPYVIGQAIIFSSCGFFFFYNRPM